MGDEPPDDEREFWYGERPRGMLTDNDRKYLLGQKDFSGYETPKKVEQQQQYRIRKRLRNAIIDFALVAEKMSDAEVEQAFSPLLVDDLDAEGKWMFEGYSSLLYLYWLVLPTSADEESFTDENERLRRLKYTTESGMQRALNFHTDGTAEVSISVDKVPAERLYEAFEERIPLTDRQLNMLLEEGHITEEELSDYNQSMEEQ